MEHGAEPMKMKQLKLEAVQKSLDLLTSFLTPALPFLNAHNIEFFTKSFWTQYLPPNIRADTEKSPVTVKNLKGHIDNLCTGAWKHNRKPLPQDLTFHNCNLQQLIQKIGELGLEHLKMTVVPHELPFQINIHDNNKPKINIGATEAELKFDPFMSPKKMHEVEAMSSLVYQAAKSAALRKLGNKQPCQSQTTPCAQNLLKESSTIIEDLIDLGSGKGYMSSFLAMLYKFRVIALDASPGNSLASQERQERLQRVWLQLIRRASERAETGTCISSRGKEFKRRQEAIEKSESKIFETKNSVKQREHVNQVNLHMIVHSQLDLSALIRNQSESTSNADAEHGKRDFGIVGLHTCGGLGVDSIRLFLQNKNALFLCNVPCCYHHLEEKMFPSTVLEVNAHLSNIIKPKLENFWINENSALNPQPTFPLSSYLTQKEFNLGRNARMLSSYSHQRIRQELEESLEVDMSLIWRLLLQVLIQEKQGHTVLEYQVGKIGKRCSSFEEYVYKALKKLHLNDIQITQAEINDVYQRYAHHFEDFHVYYIIRTMLAPLLEACILLDRLAFLLEQDEVQDAFIVKVFDDLKSPRSHAILAFKTSSNKT